MADQPAILVLNAGSSSLKFRLFAADDALTLLYKGQVEKIGATPQMRVSTPDGTLQYEQDLPKGTQHDGTLDHVLSWIDTTLTRQGCTLQAVGHRIVHGGRDYAAPVVIDDTVYTGLEALIPLAPLHQPHNLLAVKLLMQRLPDVPNIACFDTAFHRTHTPLADRFAIPYALEEEGVHRYGFHGLSYEYIATQLPSIAGDASQGRVVIAHLGNGASMCALHDGMSVDSTMGFTALDGLMMGTRCGSIDPGVLLYLMQARQMGAAAIEQLLYKESGLLGVSGISRDMRMLLASDAPRAKAAVELFCHKAAQQLAMLCTTLQGLDVLVFTAGMGEHSAAIRQQICARSAWLGISLDEQANERGDVRISNAESAVEVYVVSTNEERMIATHVRTLMDSR